MWASSHCWFLQIPAQEGDEGWEGQKLAYQMRSVWGVSHQMEKQSLEVGNQEQWHRDFLVAQRLRIHAAMQGTRFNPWLGSGDPTCLGIADPVPQWKIPHDSTKILRATTEPAATWVNKHLGIMTRVHLNHITLLAKTEINVLPIDTHLATSGERVNGLGNFWLWYRNHTWTPPPLNLLLVSLK